MFDPMIRKLVRVNSYHPDNLDSDKAKRGADVWIKMVHMSEGTSRLITRVPGSSHNQQLFSC